MKTDLTVSDHLRVEILQASEAAKQLTEKWNDVSGEFYALLSKTDPDGKLRALLVKVNEAREELRAAEDRCRDAISAIEIELNMKLDGFLLNTETGAVVRADASA